MNKTNTIKIRGDKENIDSGGEGVECGDCPSKAREGIRQSGNKLLRRHLPIIFWNIHMKHGLTTFKSFSFGNTILL